jgi:hypothetical protein
MLSVFKIVRTSCAVARRALTLTRSLLLWVSPRELFISVLITSRSPEAKGVGKRLLAHADIVAAENGVEQLRVDCFAGNGGALVRYHESSGFLKSDTYDNDGWRGQVLVRCLTGGPDIQ